MEGTLGLARSVLAIGLLAACAACSTAPRYAARWDGRRGYDGNGDYGYDPSSSVGGGAVGYRARPGVHYPVPGPPDDPWGPYITEAAARFQIPPRWIREVMRQESSGREYDADGTPITSWAGAMGLMQVMPRTYATLRQHYGLGSDPYDPHDNILAGAAYIHEMYEIYGSPNFLAAYNAGPQRVDAYLAGTPLPDETVQYLASVAPRLGSETPGGGAVAVAAAASPAAPVQLAADDPADRAFQGGGLVTADAATGQLAQLASSPTVIVAAAPVVPVSLSVPAPVVPVSLSVPAPLPAPPSPAPMPMRVVAPVRSPFGRVPPPPAGWGIQVGAFPDPARSQAMIQLALSRSGGLLAGAQSTITPVQRAGTLYEARLVGLSAAGATAACFRLSGRGMDCRMVPP